LIGRSFFMKNIVLFGSGGHAKVIADIVKKGKLFQILGLIDSNQALGTFCFGYPVLGSDDEISDLINKHSIDGGVIAVGDNWSRHLITQNILKMVPDFHFVKAIHPSAQIASQVTIKRGTVVMPGAVINSCTEIGEFCIINTNSSVDHDNVFGNYSSIMPNAATGGGVRVGEFSVLGMGASVIQETRIGAYTVIGAGSVLLENIDDYSVVAGSPAKKIKTRKKGDVYL
jgi:sugar O-acyltransferase (sialic acid O-acetyltransferase NeuD family)